MNLLSLIGEQRQKALHRVLDIVLSKTVPQTAAQNPEFAGRN